MLQVDKSTWSILLSEVTKKCILSLALGRTIMYIGVRGFRL
jgi:hypothetical protein